MPISAEQFAKNQIQQLLKDYCDAYEQLDPVAVQKLFPSVNMDALRIQLNRSKYKSVTCKFGEPTYQDLQAVDGKAALKVEVKRVYEHTIQEKPDTTELIATMKLVRSGPRNPWVIEKADYVAKPK